MRTLLDTNVLVSVLLAFDRSSSAMEQVLDAAIEGAYTLILPEEILTELEGAWAKKSFLQDSISNEQLTRFLSTLRKIAQIIPLQTQPPPPILRDPRDDFLLVAAVMGDADYLVTGDRDLLDIRSEIEQPRIVTVTEFLGVLKSIE